MKRAVWFLPFVVLLTLVIAYPACRTLILSFYRTNLANGFQSDFVGLQNFVRLAADSRFLNSITVTMLFAVISVAIEFIVGLALALAADSWIRHKGAVRTILLIPWTLPTAVIAVLWGWIFNDQYGILNTVLLYAGVLSQPLAWLASSTTAMAALVIADVWKTTPFVFIILLAGLQNIPRELYEAMEMDGGGVWARFRFVTWPFLAPFVFVALIFRLIQSFAIFDLVYVMTGGGPGGATETVSVYAYQTLMRYLDFGYGSAVAIAIVILLALIAAGLHWILLRKAVAVR